jgi:hypothetical protein
LLFIIDCMEKPKSLETLAKELANSWAGQLTVGQRKLLAQEIVELVQKHQENENDSLAHYLRAMTK